MTLLRTASALVVLAIGMTLSAREADPYDQSTVPIEEAPKDAKSVKIVLIAGTGTPKLKTGEHEYFAGCAVLMKLLQQTPGVSVVLARDGWPKKAETLQGAKCVVLFLEGGNAHAALKGERMQELQKLSESGVGIVHLHSAIDYPKDFGERVRSWSGAAFETGYSKRAHWVAAFEQFPDHPTTRGVTPFKIDDGWLWKLRFVPEMKGVTPLVKTVSPKEKELKLPDVESVVGWAYERPTGGKSFNFTGCHLHESLGQEGYRRFLVNGILWSAGVEVPKEGAPVKLEKKELKKYFDTRPMAKK